MLHRSRGDDCALGDGEATPAADADGTADADGDATVEALDGTVDARAVGLVAGCGNA